jgi:hypothetical protein
MRRLGKVLASFAVAVSLAGVVASPIGAYGGGAAHDMWQVGISFNCNNPSVCSNLGIPLGGFWGWAELDRSADGRTTWGDAEFAFCAHAVGGGGFAGAGHTSIEVESWTIETGSAGPQTFFVTGEETDSFRGTKTTFDVTHLDTGISAVPGHYSASDVLGFDPPPGVAIQIQVAFRPAR